MAIKYRIIPRRNYLHVKASGVDESLEEVARYAQAVIRYAERYRSARILCDERELEYRNSTFDSYQMAESLSNASPTIRKASTVCKSGALQPEILQRPMFLKRGVQLKVTTDMDEAINWLS
mgnify:CR=1 FL=1